MTFPPTASTRRTPRIAVAVAALLLGAGAAGAQTVMVRHVPDVSTIELFLNQTQAATAPVNRDMTTVSTTLSTELKVGVIDANVFVDRCVTRVRVVIAERSAAPVQPDAGCARQLLTGVFRVRDMTTIVLDMSGQNTTMAIAQGKPPGDWLRDQLPASLRPKMLAPIGLMVSGGGGVGWLRDFGTQACGDTASCDANTIKPAVSIGVGGWITKNIGAEGSYIRPLEATATGTGSDFNYTTVFDSEYFLLAGLLGTPVGRGRVYAKGGMDFHRATFITNQSVDNRTVTVGGVPEVLVGGSQTWALNTSGWTWAAGGGFEVWWNNWLGFYGEGMSLGAKGGSRDGEDGEVDERIISIVGGVRIHLPLQSGPPKAK